MSLFDVPAVVSINLKSGVLVESKRFGRCFVYFGGNILILAVIEDGYLNFYYYEGSSLDKLRDGFVLSLDELDSFNWVVGDEGCFWEDDFQYALMDALYLLLMNH